MTSTPLTQDDLDAALADERHLGFGYAGRQHLDADTRAQLDKGVLEVANMLVLTREDLFHWTNSKYGRWLCDHASDGNTSLGRVSDYLNPDTIAEARP